MPSSLELERARKIGLARDALFSAAGSPASVRGQIAYGCSIQSAARKPWKFASRATSANIGAASALRSSFVSTRARR